MQNLYDSSKLQNLFLRQSTLDAWEDYRRSLRKKSFIRWDYVVITASNEKQAEAYRQQVTIRLDQHVLPSTTRYLVIPDFDGKRVGSGGATLNVLSELAKEFEANGSKNGFKGKRILLIHSGGDSKRIPQYSAVGKLFSPIPRELPDGRKSCLFDELMIAMSGVPSRMQEGMVVLSGDALLLFNPLQIDTQFDGSAAISFREPVETGKDHGVFLDDGHGMVKQFLHKQTVETLRDLGAVNEQGMVNLDTGAIMLTTKLLSALFSLISTVDPATNIRKTDEKKLREFVNEKARISFYGDFLYPLASDSTLDRFYLEKPEGDYTNELHDCRTKIWKALHPFSMKVLCLAPARFIHFGTTWELGRLMSEEIGDFEFLDWKRSVLSTASYDASANYSSYCSYIGHQAKIGKGAYIEQSYVLGCSKIGEGSILSNVKIRDRKVPSGVVLHGLPVGEDRWVVRIYQVDDNPKEKVALNLADSAAQAKTALWDAPIYPVCGSMEEAVDAALNLYEEKRVDESTQRMSLNESFNAANFTRILAWQTDIRNRIISKNFIDRLAGGEYYLDALDSFKYTGITKEIYETLLQDAANADFALRIRIYYAVSRYLKSHDLEIAGDSYDVLEGKCFGTVQDMVYDVVTKKLPDSKGYKIAKDEVDVQLPVRVNFGGGWTDTPPYSNENGGVVLNAALKIKNDLPIQTRVKKLDQYVVELESQDIGVHGVFTELSDIQNCHDPYDPFALHKAALIATGIVPLSDSNESLEEILKRLGGGIYLSTQAIGIPKGSGLGTSSILAGGCVKGIFELLGLPEDNIYDIVLCMEQIMSTGGGWQDQVGGLVPGFKLITSDPGFDQKIRIRPVTIPEDAKKELGERFALIYTGQRRLARNLLRDVMGNYIGARPESVNALSEMKPTAALMTFYLEQGDIDSFAKLLDKHWELSKQLDSGSTNTCIDQIFAVVEDLIDAKFICGAGGGGFVMVILKKGHTKAELNERLKGIFQDSGVEVWESEFC